MTLKGHMIRPLIAVTLKCSGQKQGYFELRRYGNAYKIFKKCIYKAVIWRQQGTGK